MLSAILFLDKPTAISSNRALQEVRRALLGIKAGHVGTLDPLATGLLPILLGDATRLSSFLTDCDKTYFVTARLGQRTDSADSEGSSIATSTQLISENDLKELIQSRFTGEIEQYPPVFSAVKVKGLPAYRWQREKGVRPVLSPRFVKIQEISLIDYSPPFFSLSVSCTKGTYIRSLIDDIGVASGSYAHVVGLRRVRVGSFSIDQACSLDTFISLEDKSAHLLNPDVLFQSWPIWHLTRSESLILLDGGFVKTASMDQQDIHYRLYYDSCFVGIAILKQAVLRQHVLMRSILLDCLNT